MRIATTCTDTECIRVEQDGRTRDEKRLASEKRQRKREREILAQCPREIPRRKDDERVFMIRRRTSLSIEECEGVQRATIKLYQIRGNRCCNVRLSALARHIIDRSLSFSLSLSLSFSFSLSLSFCVSALLMDIATKRKN